MRQAATRTAQVQVNCFGLRTDRGWQAQRGSLRAGWGQRGGKKGRVREKVKQTEVRGEGGERDGGREGGERSGEQRRGEGGERFVQK